MTLSVINCHAVKFVTSVVACHIVGVSGKHPGARVFQEGQEKERLPIFIQFQEEIETYETLRIIRHPIIVCVHVLLFVPKTDKMAVVSRFQSVCS